MTAPASGPQTPSHTTMAQPGKYLIVTLGRESYGIPVLKVREIIRLCPITPVANMPPHVRGVINLRGKIIPLSISGCGSGCRLKTTTTATALWSRS